MRAIDAWHLGTKLEELFWLYTAAAFGSGLTRLALTGNPATLHHAARAASWGVRSHANAVRAVMGTTLVRGGTVTAGSAAGLAASSIALGYTAGAVVGTGISQLAFGEEGAKTALELYMDPSKFYEDAILGFGDNVEAIWEHYI